MLYGFFLSQFTEVHYHGPNSSYSYQQDLFETFASSLCSAFVSKNILSRLNLILGQKTSHDFFSFHTLVLEKATGPDQ